MKNNGEDSLVKYMNVSLECADQMKDHEQEFEKFYFISMVSIEILVITLLY